MNALKEFFRDKKGRQTKLLRLVFYPYLNYLLY